MQMMRALLVDYSVGYGNSYILCSEYAAEHQLLYNCSKLFYLCFKRKDLKVSPPSVFFANNDSVMQISRKNNCSKKERLRPQTSYEKNVCQCSLVIWEIFKINNESELLFISNLLF